MPGNVSVRSSSRGAAAASVLAVAVWAAPVAAQDVIAWDDRAEAAQNAPTILGVTEVDWVDTDPAPTLEILQPPQHGDAQVVAVTTRVPVDIEYTPDADYLGADSLTYRLCDATGCDDAAVDIVVRPRRVLDFATTRQAGHVSMPIGNTPALPSARFVATPFVASTTYYGGVGVDPTPEDPWDTPPGELEPSMIRMVTIPGGTAGVDTTHRIVVQEFDRQTFIGVDDDGDGQPSADEVRCTNLYDWCDMDVVQSGTEPVTWWFMAHPVFDPDAAPGTEVRVYDIPRVPGSPHQLVATGPGHADAGADYDLTVDWRDDTLRTYRNTPTTIARRAGLVEIYAEDGQRRGDVLVLMTMRNPDPDTDERVAFPLVSGRPHVATLARNERHRYLFLDVPVGATRLSATIDDPAMFDAWLIPALGPADPAVTDIANAPGTTSAQDAALGDDATLEVLNPTPGRWYVVPRYLPESLHDGLVRNVTVEARIDSVAPPPMRSGSWFNPARAGSGLFLYPAGDVWTGLMYTYDLGGLPTWYYLQAPPRLNGTWRSPLWRAAWDGDSRILTVVGELVAAPTADDTWTISYVVDGESGSQPLVPLGRGCPTFEGAPLDASGTWFDPAHDGTGYSVQLFPDYEYYAAYLYDAEGRPRFVAAESSAFAGETAELVLQQLTGACPTCAYVPPQRTDIGVLARRFEAGTFDVISTDLEFEAPLAGGWTQVDQVQSLGGPGTTQGCDP